MSTKDERTKYWVEYQAWNNLKQKCTNPKNTQYKNYGAKGIKMCDSWLDFTNFLNDVGPRPSKKHTLWVLNKDKNVDKETCEWLIKSKKTTHDMTKTPEYRAWCAMKDRCYNKNVPEYENYGGRGITVCDEWLNDFPRFLADVGPRPSPKHSNDRIDNDGNYCKENQRWATKKQQSRNTRRNIIIEYNGKVATIAEFAEIYNIPYVALLNRIKRGWTPKEAIETPLEKRNQILEFDNKKLTIKEWSEITGIPRRIIYHRINQGYSVEKIFTKPLRKGAKCQIVIKQL